MTTWKSSALSATPPAVAMARTDIETFVVQAGQVATSVAVAMKDLSTGSAVSTGVSASLTTPVASAAAVTVNGATAALILGHVYEIAAQFTDSVSGRKWTVTLIVDVPA